jgi:hypothetical protein
MGLVAMNSKFVLKVQSLGLEFNDSGRKLERQKQKARSQELGAGS